LKRKEGGNVGSKLLTPGAVRKLEKRDAQIKASKPGKSVEISNARDLQKEMSKRKKAAA
jgi:hypothetical protein